MILLRPDCLAFKKPDGEAVLKAANQMTIELLGEAAKFADESIIENAAQGVLHYFKDDLGKASVTTEEFAKALETALCAIGLPARVTEAAGGKPRVIEADLLRLARDSDKGFELSFFPRLRDELRRHLKEEPRLLRFRGLRSCVKLLVGTTRWSARCQNLQDQIVDYLRTCLDAEERLRPCAMIVD